MSADCAEIDPLLPWHLAGSLPAVEAAQVAQHLESCPRCRAALEATRSAGAIFATHLPAGLLADYGLGLPVEALPRGFIETHLAHCAECREELDLVRADSGVEGTTAGSGAPASALLPFPRRTSAAGWRVLALAASVTAAVALSLWLGEGRAPRPLPDPSAVFLELSPEAARTRAGEIRTSLSRSAAATLLLAVDRAESFEQVRLASDLVVLSACETARGAERGGEGILGLVRALQVAGARSVVASLWRVDDESAAELMARFYARLNEGLPRDEALRQAQLELLRGPVRGERDGRPVELRFSAPRHWAPFVLIGPAD